MATTTNGKPSKRVSVSKSKLHDTADALETTAEIEAIGAGAEIAAGATDISDAEKVRKVGRTVEAVGASDLTRGVDKMKAAEVAAVLSEVANAAGNMDLAEATVALAASEDLAVQSA